MTETIIGAKRRAALSNEDKRILKGALHTEGVLTNDYASVVRVRLKLGLGPLAGERDD